MIYLYHIYKYISTNKNIKVEKIYQDKKSSFEELLQKDNSVSVHMKNSQYLATEIFKVKNDLSPSSNYERSF